VNIYKVSYHTRDGMFVHLVKIGDREALEQVQDTLGRLESEGEIMSPMIERITEDAALSIDRWQYSMEQQFGAMRKGRPDLSRVEERLDPKTEEMVRDMLVSAFEGGSNYWYRIESKKLPPGTKEKDFKEGGRMQPEHYYHPMQLIPTIPGGQLVIREVSDGPGETFVLDLGALKRGLMLLKEKYPKIWERAQKGMEDASDADVFLQLSLFGKVVFG